MANIIKPENTIFVLLTFEGPDKYSLIGGLGIRMTEISGILTNYGYENHLFFVGDPYAPSDESSHDGKQNLHRWCQWVSTKYPGGVYDGEERKIAEWNRSLPNYVITEIVIPAARQGILTVIMAEDWHTAESVVILDRRLRALHLRDHCVLLWNVNNEYGFQNIDIKQISKYCSVTTVSQFMAERMKNIYGISAVSIPNGIPKRIIKQTQAQEKQRLQECFEGMVLQKTGRYDPNKGWLSAIEAISVLKQTGANPHLLMRGGTQEHRYDVIKMILENNLSYVSVKLTYPSMANIFDALHHYNHFDVIEMDFFIPEEFIMLLYGSAHAVLANSSYEPFGIVGLEVMAKRGIAIVGNTGEDYAIHFQNALRVASSSPFELAGLISDIHNNKGLRKKLRDNAFLTAQMYTWDHVLELLLEKIEKILYNYNLTKAGTGNMEGPLLAKKYY